MRRNIKKNNNIGKNNTLIIFKIDNYIEGLYIPIIEYDLFNPNTNEKLDLHQCQQSNNFAYIFIPTFIDTNNLDKHDPTSNYYKDYCLTYTTDDGTDITLYDRKNDYNNNNMSLCENRCNYLD